jgi:Ca-activated chloride channel family protein
MEHLFNRLILVGLMLVPVGASFAQEAEFTLNVDVDLVELNVAVLDERDRHVTTLTSDDFQIFEDRIPQNLALFRQDDRPVSLGLVIDNSRSMQRKKDRVDEAALSFIRQSNPEDEAFFVYFDDTVRIAQDFTAEVEKIESSLQAIEPYGQTALFDALLMGLEKIETGRYEQKAILVVSDGADNASKAALEKVRERVRESDVVLYLIGLLRDSDTSVMAREVLQSLADLSGGRAFFPEAPHEISNMTERIARELRERYTVGYVPSNLARDGGWRSVRVEIRPPFDHFQWKLNYRRGYYAPED